MSQPQTDDSDLGAFETHYSHKQRIVRSLVMVAVGLVLVPLGYNLYPLIGLGWVLVAGAGIIVGFIGLFGLPYALLYSVNQVKVYEKGFTYRTVGKRDTVRWEDISKVEMGQRVSESTAFTGGLLGASLGAMQRSDLKLTIHYGSGKKVTFNTASLPGLEDLDWRIARKREQRAKVPAL
jgi:hypothetical protein